MSNEIDPSSINLGGAAGPYQYFANYLPIDPATQPDSCLLPGGVNFEIPPTPLVPLEEACLFTFPDVIPLPPVYNPPNVKFSACETLTAVANVTTCTATKKSYLTLISTGPTPTPDNGPAGCSLELSGNICIDACESFSSKSHIFFSKAASKSSLTLTPTSTPDCGVELAGNIVVEACENFSANSNISFLKAAKDSTLSLVAKHQPDCGLDITGIITVDACETFDAKVNIAVNGDAVKKSLFSIEPIGTPDCGFTLNGDLLIEACTDFKASGKINFRGASVIANTIALQTTGQPDCGLTLSGDVEIQACTDFNVT
jgi:hypothetical protein